MHVLLFDIDGTLISGGVAGQAAMEASLAEEFGAIAPVMGIPIAGRTDRAIGMDLFRFHQVEVNDHHWSRYRNSYFRLLPDALKTHRGEILPGVVALLDQLRQREDVLLGLLTGNFAHGAHLKLSHYGLAEHFRLGGFGDEHLDRDDVAREAYKLVGNHLPDVAPDHVWVIGDTPSDIRCGRAIGANVLAVATGMFSRSELEQHRPDVALDNLNQTDAWLQRLI